MIKEMDSYGLKLCSFQADMFEKSIDHCDCGSRIFIRRFMMSDLAKRMDGKGFLFEGIDIISGIAELNSQYGPSAFGNIRYGPEEMHWMGYIYRYWAYTYEKSSRQVYRIIKPDELNKLYYPYHSLDPAAAVERIMEAKGIEHQDDIQRGVEVMRRVRENYM